MQYWPSWSTLVGPYAVIKRGPKTFVVLRKGNHVTVSVDRIKAAYLLEDFIQQPVSEHDSDPDLIDQHEIDHNIDTDHMHTRTRRVQPPSYLYGYVTAFYWLLCWAQAVCPSFVNNVCVISFETVTFHGLIFTTLWMCSYHYVLCK